MAIRVKDLRPGDNGNGVSLYCKKCGCKSSADKRDYFMLSPDYVFRCCGKPMVRVMQKSYLVEC